MDKDEVLRLAREAGFEDWGVYGRIESKEQCLERFAHFVAAAEREACATLCEETASSAYWSGEVAAVCANKIRARGNVKSAWRKRQVLEPCRSHGESDD